MIRFRATALSHGVLSGLLCWAAGSYAEPASSDAPAASSSSIPSQDTVTSGSPSAQSVIEQHLAVASVLMQQRDYRGVQAECRAILQLDATHREALLLMTKAQRQLEAETVKAQRTRAALRNQALDLALNMAREKANQYARQETHARGQLAQAREQQLKTLYARGLGLYRQGHFQAAIDAFQQMVQVDPAHPLVREAQRLITRAETKQAETRARVVARASGRQGTTLVSELEQQLTAKRIEIETVLKYSKIAIKEHNHEMAIGLLQRVLVQDPQHHEAQQLLEQVQTARLKEQEERLERQVAQDEQRMVNEVVKTQLLPEAKSVRLSAPPVPRTAAQELAQKLREPISFDFTDVALGDVLGFIADAANLSIVPSPQLDLRERHVSLKVTQLPLELALKYLAKSQSLAYRLDQDAVLLATQEEFSNESMETRIFFLHGGLGPFALEAAAVQANPAMTAEPIKELIEKSVPQPSGSKLVMDERSGGLIATNTAENLALMERLLSQLDVTPVQVLIEARFIELTMTELEQLGMEAVLTGNYALSKGHAADGLGPGDVITKGDGVKFSDLARQDEGGNFTLEGVLTALQFESVLHTLQETKKSKTLSAPRVTTLNNQTATIRVVEEFNYPTRYEVKLVQFDINGDGDFDDAGETEFVNVPQDFKKRDVGILLNVTPSIGKDLKTITLVLAPEVSQAGSFRDLGGGVSVPDFTSSQLTTSVVIENGETAVLGGLMKDTTSTQVSKVPLLGDLPFVGGLFRQTRDSSERKNLLIFITARLLAPRGPTI